eukprot:gene61397-83978_t
MAAGAGRADLPVRRSGLMTNRATTSRRKETVMPESSKIAVVGLGSMGLGMALSLLRAGHAVTGCDLSETARQKLVAAGGRVEPAPAQAARGADILIVVVVNAAQTEAVLFGEAGAVAALAPGSVVVSSATMAPSDAKAFAARAAEQGVLYLDGPISGGAVKAA